MRTHVAIMSKSWRLTNKILTGEKTIESRWYMNRYQPWDNIGPGDIIYFKDSGGPVKISAKVAKVRQLENLTPDKVKNILNKYAKPDGLGVDPKEISKYYEMFKNKKFCLIIFLKQVREITPFEINKTGYGAMAAWLVIDNINKIKR